MSETTKTRKRARVQKGGEAPVQISKSDAPSFTPLPSPPPKPIVDVPTQEGGRKDVKVILDKSKNKTKKLILSAPKKIIKLPSGSPDSNTVVKKHPSKTHKVARRIRVSVDALNKRVNRAKTIKKESQVMSIEKLKKDLEGAGLIKVGSKAPESILRQMYTDFQVLKQRAL